MEEFAAICEKLALTCGSLDDASRFPVVDADSELFLDGSETSFHVVAAVDLCAPVNERLCVVGDALVHTVISNRVGKTSGSYRQPTAYYYITNTCKKKMLNYYCELCDMRRRTVLATAGMLGCMGFGGCAQSSIESGEVRPTGEPPAVPEKLRCDDKSYERADLLGSEPQWGNGSEFKLRIEDLSYDYGDTATIALTHS
jgi:hypothetical protein